MLRHVWLVLIVINLAVAWWGWQREQEESAGLGLMLPALADQRLLMGHEMTASSLQQRAEEAQKACLGVMLDSEALAKTWSGWLQSKGVAATMVRYAEAASPDYWVYLEARDVTQRQSWLDRLSAEGIDAYVIDAGQLKGFISIGRFTRRSAADYVQATVSALGLKPLIYSIDHASEQWVLRVDSSYADTWAEIIAGLPAKDQQQMQLSKILCN